MNEKNNSIESISSRNSLQKIAQGSAIVFIGILLNYFLIFVGRLLIIRNWTLNDYGIYSLSYAILTIAVLFSSLGLTQGVVRNISYYRNKEDIEKIPILITSSLFFSILVSIITGFLIIITSEIISLRIFHDSNLIMPLRIFGIGIPILNTIEIIVAIFRGFEDVKPVTYFKFILIELFFTIFIGFLIVYNLNFENIFYGYIICMTIVLIFLIIYILIKKRPLKYLNLKFINNPISKDLIIFSLPLFGSAMLVSISYWTDTFMLGNIKTPIEVGLYNAITPLAQFINFPLLASTFIYIPVLSGLFAKKKLDEIKRIYIILTKWVSLGIYPIFLLFILYPSEILNYLFGSEYIPAAIALRILSIGYIINNLTGQSYPTLVVIGKTRFAMFSYLVAAILNIILNSILIPMYGINGATISSLLTILVTCILKSWILYSSYGIQPFSKNLIKPTILSFILMLVLYYILGLIFIVNVWLIISLFIIFYIIVILSIIITKSIDREDLDLLDSIEKRTGFKFKFIKKLLKNFY